jgi:hypothetical protein
MKRWIRFYNYGVLGAIGGLIGWQISNLLGLSFTTNIYLAEVVVGALIGLSIGFFIGLAEGLLRRNLVHTARSALISGGLGLVGGAVGLPLAEGLFQLLGGGAAGRLLGWGIFGLLTGLAAGFTGGTQMWKGALGGFVGGLLGSTLLAASRQWLSDPLLGKAAGIILLGAAVGTFIALMVYILAKAWIEVTSGKLKGMEFILDKFLKPDGPGIFIGSDALKAELVLPDPDIAPQHAMLKGYGSHFTIKDMSLNGTFVNNKRVEITQLKNQQTIHLGNTELVYHEKR